MSTYIGRQSDSRGKSYCRLILLKASVLNFEGLDILRVKIYCHLILLRASVLNFEHLDILRDTIRHPSKKLLSFILLRASILNFERLDILRDSFGHPSKKLLSFYIAQNFCSEFRASRYTTGFNRTSE